MKNRIEVDFIIHKSFILVHSRALTSKDLFNHGEVLNELSPTILQSGAFQSSWIFFQPWWTWIFPRKKSFILMRFRALKLKIFFTTSLHFPLFSLNFFEQLNHFSGTEMFISPPWPFPLVRLCVTLKSKIGKIGSGLKFTPPRWRYWFFRLFLKIFIRYSYIYDISCRPLIHDNGKPCCVVKYAICKGYMKGRMKM